MARPNPSAADVWAPLAASEWAGLTNAALWFALILVLLAGAIKLTRDYRRGRLRFLGGLTGRAANSADDAHLTLTKFRELHERGGLSDSEYRIIKSKLASELSADDLASVDPAGGNEASAAPTPRDNLALVESLKASLANDAGADDGAGGANE